MLKFKHDYERRRRNFEIQKAQKIYYNNYYKNAKLRNSDYRYSNSNENFYNSWDKDKYFENNYEHELKPTLQLIHSNTLEFVFPKNDIIYFNDLEENNHSYIYIKNKNFIYDADFNNELSSGNNPIVSPSSFLTPIPSLQRQNVELPHNHYLVNDWHKDYSNLVKKHNSFYHPNHQMPNYFSFQYHYNNLSDNKILLPYINYSFNNDLLSSIPTLNVYQNKYHNNRVLRHQITSNFHYSTTTSEYDKKIDSKYHKDDKQFYNEDIQKQWKNQKSDFKSYKGITQSTAFYYPTVRPTSKLNSIRFTQNYFSPIHFSNYNGGLTRFMPQNYHFTPLPHVLVSKTENAANHVKNIRDKFKTILQPRKRRHRNKKRRYLKYFKQKI